MVALEFTEPEILRSSLASVILRMSALRLGDVAEFPFIEAPSSRLIADGYLVITRVRCGGCTPPDYRNRVATC